MVGSLSVAPPRFAHGTVLIARHSPRLKFLCKAVLDRPLRHAKERYAELNTREVTQIVAEGERYQVYASGD